MKRDVLAVTGSRAEYGSMRPVFRSIVRSPLLSLQLIVTGMHLSPHYQASLAEIDRDAFCPCHRIDVTPVDGTAYAMARCLGESIERMTEVISALAPDLVLVQGDRGEMLAATIAAAHLNIAVAHMSGGDRTGSIDDSIRAAITSFAHVHLTTCAQSSTRVIASGESPARVFEVGEPSIDVISSLDPLPWSTLATELDLDPSRPVVLATQHPVTTEAEGAAAQVTETLEALAELGMQTVFTYPNTDAGYEGIVRTLESYRERRFLRVIPHLGSLQYLSLMRVTALVIGNSSSGIIEAGSFKVPVVNIGTRQHLRTRAANVVDAGYDRSTILAAARYALEDPEFRARVAECKNPYGDGHCAERTVDILSRLRLGPMFTAKWLDRLDPIVEQ